MSASYQCERCGHRGKSSIEKGKLNWRLEWPALWKVYQVDIEPFGKDHATPGGSRDSCAEIAETIMHFRPPMGIPYEWVGIADRGKDLGDMGSSDFLGFTPAQWVEIGDPEVLRYIYAFNPIARRVVLDLYRVDSYHDTFDRAEDAFYSAKRQGDEDDQARSYELAYLASPPKEKPVALTKKGGLPVETGRFFRDLYLILLGSEKGPRAAPFLAVLEKDWVVRRLSEATQ